MKGKFPRKVMLYNRQGNTQLFKFATLREEQDVVNAGGWIENPAEWAEPEHVIEPEKVVEEIKEPEEKPKSKIPFFNERSKEFACDKCDFLGKNTRSLKAHIKHKHKED